METPRTVIAVDGLAGSGKSTISKLLATKLNYAHLNSGLLYRTVALLARRSAVNPDDAGALEKLIQAHRVELVCDDSLSSKVMLDGEDVTWSLQAPEVSEVTSRAAVHREVRSALIKHQRGAFPGYGLVAEGRDMGTVVFPDAPVKFFITASEEIRVQRRIQQLTEKSGKSISEAGLNELKSKMKMEISERDRRDAERTLSPTKPASDSIIVDNSALPLTRIVENMYDEVRKRGL